MGTDPRDTHRWIVGSLAWTILVSGALLVVPLGTEVTCSDTGGCSQRNTTLLDETGRSVLLVLLAPVVLPALGLLLGRARRAWLIGLGVTYLALVALAILTIGIFYLPAAIALLVAGLLMPSISAVRRRQG